MRSMQTFVAVAGLAGAVTLGLMAPGALFLLAFFLLAALLVVLLVLGEPVLAQWWRWWRGPAPEREEE